MASKCSRLLLWVVTAGLAADIGLVGAAESAASSAKATTIPRRLTGGGLAPTQSQVDAWASLQAAFGQEISITWDGTSGGPSSISGLEFVEPSGDITRLLDRFYSNHWTSISALLGISPVDTFDLRILTTGYGDGTGYRVRYHRRFDSILVPSDFLELRVVHRERLKAGRQDSDASSGPLILVEVVARIHRDLPLRAPDLLSDSLSSEVAILASAADNLPALLADSAEQVFVYIDGTPHLAWRCPVATEEPDSHLGGILVDANTGVVLRKVPSRLLKTGTITTPVSRPHETTKTYRPLPTTPLHLTVDNYHVPCRGLWYLGATDYHGTFDISIPDVPWSPTVPCTARPDTTCPSGDCVYPAAQFSVGSTTQEEQIFDPAVIALGNQTLKISGLLAQPDGHTYLLPYLPTLSRFERCNGSPENSILYDYKVRAADWSGLRLEMIYNINRTQHIWSDYAGIPQIDTYARFPILRPTPGSTNSEAICGAGAATMMTLGDQFATVTVPCTYCSGDRGRWNTSTEAGLRYVLAHEFTHIADLSAHDGFLSHHFLGDLPKCQNFSTFRSCCFGEGIADFAPAFLNNYEAINYNISSSFTYPSSYRCGQSETCDSTGCNGCDPYWRGQAFTRPFNEFVLSGGPTAFKAIARMMQNLSLDTRYLDPSCASTWTFEDCWQDSVLRSLVSEANSDLLWATERLGAEASRAWHRTIVDGNPGFLGCPAECGAAMSTDPLPDYFPWWDDISNISLAGTMIPLDAPVPGFAHGVDGTIYGVVDFFPESCGTYRVPGTSSTAFQCKALSLDSLDDFDFFTVFLRSGETYRVWTDVPTSGDTTDTILDVVDSDGIPNPAWHNDDCTDPSFPHSSLSSCLVLQPTESGVYGIMITPYPNSSRVGSAHHYKVNIAQSGDDYGDSMASATPAHFVGSAPTVGYINSDTDEDWFYTYYDSTSQSIDFHVRASTGLSNIAVTVFNQELSPVFATTLGPTVQARLFGLPQGVYFMKVTGDGFDTGKYEIDYFYGYQLAKYSQDEAVDLDEVFSPYPLGYRAFSSSTGTGPVYHRVYLERGSYFTADVRSDGGNVLLLLERDLRQSLPEHERIGLPSYADSHGGLSLLPNYLASSATIERAARIQIVVPWSAYYFLSVSSDTPTRYVLYTTNFGDLSDAYFSEP